MSDAEKDKRKRWAIKRNRAKRHIREKQTAEALQHLPGKPGSVYVRKKSGAVTIGTLPTAHHVSHPPGVLIANKIKAAMQPTNISYCKVLAPDGTVKWYLCPVTRRKISIEEMEAIMQRRKEAQ